MNIIYKIYILNMEKNESSRTNTSMIKNLELILMPINAATVIGIILLCVSGPLKIADLEIWGYYLMAFSILLSFLILIGWRGVLNVKKNEEEKGILSNIVSILGLVIERLPALLLFGQLLWLGMNTNEMIKSFGNGEPPAIVSDIKYYIFLLLFLQLGIYFKYYTASLKSFAPPDFNTATFAIISLSTVFLIVKLNMIIEHFKVDG